MDAYASQIFTESKEMYESSPGGKFSSHLAAYLYLLSLNGEGEIVEEMEDGQGCFRCQFELEMPEMYNFQVKSPYWEMKETDQGFVNAYEIDTPAR